jgi:hypothetical protein
MLIGRAHSVYSKLSRAGQHFASAASREQAMANFKAAWEREP